MTMKCAPYCKRFSNSVEVTKSAVAAEGADGSTYTETKVYHLDAAGVARVKDSLNSDKAGLQSRDVSASVTSIDDSLTALPS